MPGSPNKMQSPTHSAGSAAVLSLDGDLVEWLDLSDPDRPRYGRSTAAGPRAADRAQAAEEAIADAGGEGGAPAFVLALGDGHVRQRLLPMPELPRRERYEVFRRKAQRLLESESGEAIFSASLVDRQGLAADGQGARRQTWLLTAVERRAAEGLRSELSRRGLRVARIVARRTAALSRAHRLVREHAADDERAWMAVGIDRRATCVNLFAGDRWITRYELTGSFLDTPLLGASLLQDLQGCSGFWRKVSRGDEVAGVVVTGLDESRARSLGDSIRAVLGDVVVLFDPPAAAGRDGGAVERLQAALEPGPFQAELDVRIPPGRRMTAAVLTSVTAAVVALSAVVDVGTEPRLTELLETHTELTRSVSARESGAREHRARAERGLALLGELERAGETAGEGLPFAALTKALVGAFEQRALLETVGVRRGDDGSPRLVATGRVDPEPRSLVARLRELGDLLEGSGLLCDVEILPATEVPPIEQEGRRGAVEFTVRATLREDLP